MAHRNRSENVVATRDVPTKPKRVEFAPRMEPRPRYSSAATGDVPPMSEKEEFVTNITRKVVSTQSPTRRFKQTLMSLLSFRLVNENSFARAFGGAGGRWYCECRGGCPPGPPPLLVTSRARHSPFLCFFKKVFWRMTGEYFWRVDR